MEHDEEDIKNEFMIDAEEVIEILQNQNKKKQVQQIIIVALNT